MKILGIETSCDETAAAIAAGEGSKVTILSSVVSSQIELHQKYGGVVPEIAAREHVLNILPVINEAMERADITKKDIDAIAVATGPGLVTSLLVGTETAKTLAYAWQKPIISINHIEGHIYANFIGDHNIVFPAMVLTVSGGHTALILMKKHGQMKTIGQTRDDAAGEAFDKAAKLLGLGYPGGPIISHEASKAVKSDIKLPRPMLDSKDYDFSFSGLKTAIRYEVEKDKNWKKQIPEYCHEFQQAVVDVLVTKTIKAAKAFKVKTVMLAGGVAANTKLREQMEKAVTDEKLIFRMPELAYTTDNAAMMASAGYFKAKNKQFTDWKDIKVDSNFEL